MEESESVDFVPDLIKGIKTALSDIGMQDTVILCGENIAIYGGVLQFYVQRGFKPAWTSYARLNRNGEIIADLIENAREYGLEPILYHLDIIRGMEEKLSHETNSIRHRQYRERTEILLTDAVLKFMINLHAGYRVCDSALLTESWVTSLPDKLLHGIGMDRLHQTILSVQPQFLEYGKLQKATGNYLKQNILTDDYQALDETGEDSVMFNHQLIEVLSRLGYFEKKLGDTALSAALRKFQRHHGLEPDGRAGKNTLEALRMSTLYHYRMLALNLDRYRKQEDTGIHLLYVNIPAYKLKVFRGNHLQDSYRVIVGDPKTPTPQMTSSVERIIANPTWHVPRSILRNELSVKIKSDTGYLKRNRFKLVDKHNRTVSYETIDTERISDENFGYTLRQDAGSDNALGKVKFIFSNPYAVYMHDTPGKALFSKDMRALSHGCIRVQNPEKLADYLVRLIHSDTTDISRLIDKGVHREFNLSTAIPIRISYITCDVDEKGDLYFYKDIYGIDRNELEKMAPYMDMN
jgi:murein L,D-transpeptidase YcbB/YkuD